MFGRPRKAPSLVQDPEFRRTETGIEFRLHDVEILEFEREFKSTKSCFEDLAERELLYSAPGPEQTPVHSHGFLETIYIAYAKHQPLSISPDQFWLAILQGFAHHVKLNSEKLRSRLVDHDGVKQISVSVLANTVKEIHWPSAILGFCNQVKGRSSKLTNEWAVREFSTTNPTTHLAFQVALLDILQPYYDYVITGICGIPKI